MLVVDLVCSSEHRFEGWFSSHEDLETQRERGLLTCPVCGAREVRRLPSAPHVSRGGISTPQRAVATPPETLHTPTPPIDPAKQLQHLMDTLRQRAAQAEDVGQRFADEARKIHHGDAEERPIRGQASAKETISLLEEGISVLPVPSDKKDLH